MRRRGIGVAAALGVVLLAGGCGSSDDQGDAASSAADYYAAMDVGDFAEMSDEDLDELGKGLCSDLGNMTAEERPMSVLLLRESTDTEQEAFEVGKAIAQRWCPEHVGVYDY